MHLLVFLAENAGEAVSKEQILDNVWPDVFVGEGVVWQIDFRTAEVSGR